MRKRKLNEKNVEFSVECDVGMIGNKVKYMGMYIYCF